MAISVGFDAVVGSVVTVGVPLVLFYLAGIRSDLKDLRESLSRKVDKEDCAASQEKCITMLGLAGVGKNPTQPK